MSNSDELSPLRATEPLRGTVGREDIEGSVSGSRICHTNCARSDQHVKPCQEDRAHAQCSHHSFKKCCRGIVPRKEYE